MGAEGMDRTERWAGPAAGIVGAVAAMTGLALSDYGALSDVAGFDLIAPSTSGNAIARALAENRDRVQLGTILLMVGLFSSSGSWSIYRHGSTRPERPAGWRRWRRSVD